MKEKKMRSPKVSRVLLIIGIILFVIGVLWLIASISQFAQARQEYKEAYDAWHDAWWEDHTASLNDQPTFPAGKGVPIVMSIFLIIGSLGISFVGAGPFLAKTARRYKNEITEALHKESEDKQETTPDKEESASTVSRRLECRYCGAKMSKGSHTCNYCGKEN